MREVDRFGAACQRRHSRGHDEERMNTHNKPPSSAT
jgi:hypothetical protein